MTREEAIKYLEDALRECSVCLPHRRGSDAEDMREWMSALETAISALRAQQEPVKLDRSGWKGCWWCKKSGGVLLEDHHALRPEKKRGCVPAVYCPNCGRPLSRAAWVELERRMGGNDEKTDNGSSGE